MIRKSSTAKQHFECVALLLQGGGALGAYQGGVYDALVEAELQPDWVAGISIGAINAAIIAGNPPEARVPQLRAFWHEITASPFGSVFGGIMDAWLHPAAIDAASSQLGDKAHAVVDQLNAFQAAVVGVPGFYSPRMPPPWLLPSGRPEATSFYDTAALTDTLKKYVDFDRINSNSKTLRLSVGAVNVRTGNFCYFDTKTHKIRPEHILASGALPPGFAAVEIDGEHYWDGGMVSNTPLQWVVDAQPRRNMLAFQVDLWSSRGNLPRDLAEVAVRQKEIQYSSRTRASTDQLKHLQKIRATLSKLLADVPDGALKSNEAKLLKDFADQKFYNIVQLIYRAKPYEGNSKDSQFSRLSMTEHWRAGHEDAVRALGHAEIFEQPQRQDSFRAFDYGWTAQPTRPSQDETL
jgi:NTE family protein